MTFLKKMLFILFLFVVSGCVNQHISLENRARIKKVAVISLMGDDLFRLRVGTTPFNTSSQYWDVTRWNIDRFVEETVISSLSARSGYEFVHYDPEKTSIKNLYGSTRNLDIETRNIKDVLPKLQGLAAELNVDAFVVVKRGPSKLWPEVPDYLVAYGSTLVCQSLLKQVVSVRLYLIFNVSVVDARTMQVTAVRYDRTPSCEMDRGFCKDELAELTPAELGQMETKIKQMLKENIPERLDKLGL